MVCVVFKLCYFSMTMSEKELKELQSDLIRYTATLAESKAESKQLLVDLGVINQEGEVNKEYQDLCIPQVQD
jgi:hypothetical protein